MKLWVRSQDKDRLTLVNDLRIYHTKDEDVYVIEDCDDLAIYKTKERAIEVLDEIEKFISKTDLEGKRYYAFDVYQFPME